MSTLTQMFVLKFLEEIEIETNVTTVHTQLEWCSIKLMPF